jgi:hypothetical protein
MGPQFRYHRNGRRERKIRRREKKAVSVAYYLKFFVYLTSPFYLLTLYSVQWKNDFKSVRKDDVGRLNILSHSLPGGTDEPQAS